MADPTAPPLADDAGAGLPDETQGEPRRAGDSPGSTASADSRARWSFLAQASNHLADSLDYETTLRTVAGLSVPMLGSWSIVDLLEADDTIHRLAVVHPQPEWQDLARRLEAAWPPHRDDPLGIPVVARTGKSELISHVPDALLVEMARDGENLRLLRELGISSLMTVPMRARGRILGAMTFLSSSPERVFHEADVSLAEDLARRCAVAISNARLHRDALSLAEAEAARHRAEAADRVKSEFLMLLSHELRTPLNGIAGYLELLAMEIAGPLTERQRQYMDRLQAGERQLLRMVEDMLNFIRLYSGGQVHYEMCDVALATVVDDLVQAYRPVLEEKGLEFQAQCPPALRAHTDPAKVWQVLFNLLSNARKFTEPGGRVVLEGAAESDRVLLRVRNSGAGIVDEELERIFDPFVQGEQGLTRRSDGLGLGLTVSRELARGMGGDLHAESTAGDGCTFTLDLPTARA